MKKILLLLLMPMFAIGQNQVPQITGLNVQINQVAQTLTITYNLTDAENDACEISLKVSNNFGESYQVNTSTATGDIGFPITPGNNKTITWPYGNLTSLYGYKVRLVADDKFAISIQDIVNEIDSMRIKNDVYQLQGVRNNSNTIKYTEARDTIENRFVRYGLDTEIQTFTYLGQQGRNIIGNNQGLKTDTLSYIIDGHYDGVNGSPAADDNASAFAGMLEAARVLSKYKFEKTVRFIGFDQEEIGLIGSSRYVSQGGVKPFDNIQGVLNFEMIGFWDNRPNTQIIPAGFDILFPQATAAIQSDSLRGNFLANVANAASNPLRAAFDSCAALYVPDLKVISLATPGNGTLTPDLRRSDHAPFWDTNRQALMLTNSAEFRNNRYHTPGDSASTLNYTFASNVVKAAVATAAAWAKPIHASYADFELATNTHNHTKFPCSILIFPNPSKSDFSVEIKGCNENVVLELYALNGKLLASQQVRITNELELVKFNNLNLTPGNYLLIAKIHDASQTLKVVVTD